MRTRDPFTAQAAAYRFGMEIMAGKLNWSEWRLKKTADSFEIETDGSAEDHERGMEALKLLLQTQPLSLEPNLRPIGTGMKIADACDKYLASRQGEITESTRRSWLTALTRLKKEYGSILAGEVTTEQLDKIKNELDAAKRARATIENYFDTFDLLFCWLVEIGEIKSNPVRKPSWSRTIAKRLDAERGIPRLPYSRKDLELLFDRTAMDALKRPEELWLPLLALFTGARLEALCSLQCNDFQEYEPGAWALRFSAEYDKPGRGNQIPLHQTLIEAGLIHYINDVISVYGKESFIFPYLSPIGGRRGHYPSKQFGERRRALGFERGKDFHSFRTTLISCLQFNRADPSIKRAFAGHEDGDPDDVHARNYEKAEFTTAQVAAEILPRLDYPAYLGFWPELIGLYQPGQFIDRLVQLMEKQKRSRTNKARKAKSK